MNKKIQELVDSQKFQRLVIIAIVLCSLLLGVETYFPDHVFVFDFLDAGFTIFFVFEIILRILAADNIASFFKLAKAQKIPSKETDSIWKKYKIEFDEDGFWNCFDFSIVLVSSISLFSHFVEHPEFLIVSRLARVSRIMRLLEVSSNLKVVEKKIVSIIPTVFSFALLLGILLYIYSIIGIYLFGHREFEMADFHDLPSALLTLFQLMTLDGWAEVMESTAIPPYDGWFYKGYFVSFVILTAIISFNVFVAVLTSQVDEKMQEERKRSEERISHQIEEVEDEVEEAEAELLKSMSLILSEVKGLKEEITSIKKKLNE